MGICATPLWPIKFQLCMFVRRKVVAAYKQNSWNQNSVLCWKVYVEINVLDAVIWPSLKLQSRTRQTPFTVTRLPSAWLAVCSGSGVCCCWSWGGGHICRVLVSSAHISSSLCVNCYTINKTTTDTFNLICVTSNTTRDHRTKFSLWYIHLFGVVKDHV